MKSCRLFKVCVKAAEKPYFWHGFNNYWHVTDSNSADHVLNLDEFFLI